MAVMPQVNFMTPQQMLAQRLAGVPFQQQPAPDQTADPALAPDPAQVTQPSLDYGQFTDAEQQNALGERLMAGAGSGPVRTGWEGAGRLGKMLSGALLKGSAARSEKDYTKKRSDYLASSLSGDNANIGEAFLKSGDPKLQELGLSITLERAKAKAASDAKLDEPHVVGEGASLITGRGKKVGEGGPKSKRFIETPKGLADPDALDETGAPKIVIPKSNNPNQPFNEDGTPNKSYQDYQRQRDVDRRVAIVNNPSAPPQSGLTKEAIDNGAAYFIQTGTMPVGLRNRADQTVIQNRIGELKPKDMDAATWMRGLTNAGMSFNARKQAAASTGKQQALTVVNEDTVNGSIKILDDLLKQGAASNLTFTKANDALQWYRRETNDPLAIKLKNTIGTLSNEYARVMTGQTGGAASSDSARNEAATRMLLGFKDGTMRSVAANLQQEMKVRSDSYLKVMNQLTGGSYSGPEAEAQVDIDPAAKPSAPATLAPDHAALLKKYGVE